MSYIDRESYKHKFAKQVFKEWVEKWEERGKGGGRVSIPTNYFNNDDDVIPIIIGSSSRSALLEYPIVIDKKRDIDSMNMVWDEIWAPPEQIGDEIVLGTVPTYDQCKSDNLNPIAIVDIVLTWKGMPSYLVEICHTNPVSDEKINKLEKLATGGQNLIEIDADWILKQIGVPSKLEIKRWLF